MAYSAGYMDVGTSPWGTQAVEYLSPERAQTLNALEGAGGGGGSAGGGGSWVAAYGLDPNLPRNGTPGGASTQTPQLINTNYSQEQFDPWSRYRAGAGTMLNNQLQSGDPSDYYRDKLAALVGGNGQDFATSDPSYQFRFQQGQKATERSLAAKGLLNSGNAAAAISDYGQQAASQEYGAQFDRLLKGMQGVSQQYDLQQQRLMKMAGVDLDPAMAAKLGLQAEGINTDRINSANQYNLGTIEAANTRYGIDTQASTSRNSDLMSAIRARASVGPGSIDTESLFAGKAAAAVDSANWWADSANRLG